MKSIILILLVLLSGCGTTTPAIQVKTQIVEVPVAVFCEITMPEVPKYNFDALKKEDSIHDKVKALLADKELRSAYEIKLAIALNSCRK